MFTREQLVNAAKWAIYGGLVMLGSLSVAVVFGLFVGLLIRTVKFVGGLP